MSPDKPRIMFVDDDPALLAALQNVLHRDRKRWDMEFVLGGEAALEVLAKSRFDVVVCDMRMPVVDGARLLAVVKATMPSTVRIMLSGSDCATIIPDVDELLVKPCGAQTLRSAIERLLVTHRKS